MRMSFRLLNVIPCVFLTTMLLSYQTVQAAPELEEVVVTGSYIKGAAEDASLPITTLQREDLALSGSPTTMDLIKSLSFSQGDLLQAQKRDGATFGRLGNCRNA